MSKSDIHPLDWDAFQSLIGDLQALEQRASRMKMFETMHAINAAKNKAGWELAGQMERTTAPKAGERV